MSLLNHLRQSEEIHPDWQVLSDLPGLSDALALLFERPVALFKHSTRCGISAHAKYRLENDWSFTADELVFFYLDLITFRPVSNHIAETLGVVHQSPQVILLKDGKAVYDASHHRIQVAGLREAMEATR